MYIIIDDKFVAKNSMQQGKKRQYGLYAHTEFSRDRYKQYFKILI